MGLDITAYSRLRLIGRHEMDLALNRMPRWMSCNRGKPRGVYDWCTDETHIQAYVYAEYTDSFRGIPTLGVAVIDGAILVEGGCYEETAQTETCRFYAGSYYDYNAWRADLRAQFNPKCDPDGPFYELLYFADNAGCIGPDAAADLLADFERHAKEYRPPSEGGRERYEDWTLAARLAARGGLIQFH